MSRKPHALDTKDKIGIKHKIKSILERNEILFAYIHGSFVKGDFRDIDIAIYLSSVDKEKTALEIELGLETQLEEKTGYRVDVRVLNGSPLSFKFNVIKDRKLLFSRDETLRSDFESLTFAEYHDFAPYRKRYLREALGLEV